MKKRWMMLWLAVGWALGVAAQQTVESIREAYQEYSQRLATSLKDCPYPPEYYHLEVVQNLPGTGGHREDVYMLWDEVPDEEDEGNPYPPHVLRYATCKYNFAAREFYEEYLFDQQGRLMFVYARTPGYDFNYLQEYRLYFDGGRLLKCIVKNADHDYDARDIPASAFKEVYNGSTIPEEYKEFLEGTDYLDGKRFLELFKSIDDNTHL